METFTDLNARASEAMSRDEPETALEFLKKADDMLYKLQQEDGITEAPHHFDSINNNCFASTSIEKAT